MSKYRATVSFSGPYGAFEEGKVYEESRPVVKDWLRAGFFVPVNGPGSAPSSQANTRRRRSKAKAKVAKQ